MIISPPFLPTRTANQTDAGYVVAGMPSSPVNCPQTSVPEGSYPISLNMGWHGGTHYQAPSQNSSAITVRAIADGEIVFARKPTTANTTPEAPLNYNPYGTQPTWTDDGLVIIKHTTDIGTTETATGIVYYSLICHLAQLKGNAAKVAAGIATDKDKQIHRKDEIGFAGQLYGGNASNHIHMEIVCDDDNLQKILGRQNLYDDLDTNTHGRADAIYGEIYFRLPIGTKLYQTQPADNTITPATTNATVKTLDAINIIGLRYSCGEAPQTIAGVSAGKGGAVLTTYLEDGSIITNGQLAEIDAEYNLYKRATHISKTYQDAHAPKVPAPSAVYELLRFGRIINTDNETLDPADTPHWRKIKYDGGEGWVNLNQTNITIYSDADFPPWKGWRLIHDDLDGDSRCTSAQLISMIEEVSQADGKLTKAELIQRMGLSTVRAALKKTICAFPSEWIKDTIDARWDWLKTDPDYKLEGKDWDNYRKHVAALTVSASQLPDAFSNVLWHFEPSAFIMQFRMCGWLSEGELARVYPDDGYPKTALEKIGTSPNQVREKYRVILNKITEKYFINTSVRKTHFYGQGAVESMCLALMIEGSARFGLNPTHQSFKSESDGYYTPTNPRDYLFYLEGKLGNIEQGDGPKFRGRGMKQLTGRENYSKYWVYRSWLNLKSFESPWWSPARPNIAPAIPDPQKLSNDAYSAIDAGAWYWEAGSASNRFRTINTIILNGTIDRSSVFAVAKAINGINQKTGEPNGLKERIAFTKKVSKILMDNID